MTSTCTCGHGSRLHCGDDCGACECITYRDAEAEQLLTKLASVEFLHAELGATQRATDEQHRAEMTVKMEIWDELRARMAELEAALGECKACRTPPCCQCVEMIDRALAGASGKGSTK